MTTANSNFRIPWARTMAAARCFLAVASGLVVLCLTPASRGAEPADPLQALQRQVDKRRLDIERGDAGDPTTWYRYGGFDPNTWEERNPYAKRPAANPGRSDVVAAAFTTAGIFEDEQTWDQEGPVPVTDEQVRLLARIPTLRVLSFGDADLKPRHFEMLAALAELKSCV